MDDNAAPCGAWRTRPGPRAPTLHDQHGALLGVPRSRRDHTGDARRSRRPRRPRRFPRPANLPRGTLRRGRGSTALRCARNDPGVLRHTMHIGEFGVARLGLPSDGGAMDAVGIIPGQIVTEHLRVAPHRCEWLCAVLIPRVTSSNSRASSDIVRQGMSASESSSGSDYRRGQSRRPSRTTRTISSSPVRTMTIWHVQSGKSSGWMAACRSSSMVRCADRCHCPSLVCSPINPRTLSRKPRTTVPPSAGIGFTAPGALRDALIPRPLRHPGSARHRSRLHFTIILVIEPPRRQQRDIDGEDAESPEKKKTMSPSPCSLRPRRSLR